MGQGVNELFKLSRPSYLDVDDTCDEVGITRRQLVYWEQQQLITPELGQGSRKYTSLDVRRLKILRRLIVEEKLPIPYVKERLEAEVEQSLHLVGDLIELITAFGAEEEESLDQLVYSFQDHKLFSDWKFARRRFYGELAVWERAHLISHWERVLLLLLRDSALNARTWDQFAESKYELLGCIEHYSRMARVTVGEGFLYEPFALLRPSNSPEESEFNPTTEVGAFQRAVQKLEPIFNAFLHAERTRELTDEQRQMRARFWTLEDKQAIDALSKEE